MYMQIQLVDGVLLGQSMVWEDFEKLFRNQS